MPPAAEKIFNDGRFTVRQREAVLRLLNGNPTRITAGTLRALRTRRLILEHLPQLTKLGREIAEHLVKNAS
jgi:hypothetical protein